MSPTSLIAVVIPVFLSLDRYQNCLNHRYMSSILYNKVHAYMTSSGGGEVWLMLDVLRPGGGGFLLEEVVALISPDSLNWL